MTMMTKRKNSSDNSGLWFISSHRGAPRFTRKVVEDKNTSTVAPLLSLDVQLHRSVVNSHKPCGGNVTAAGEKGIKRNFQSKESWDAWNQQASRAAMFLQEEALAAQVSQERNQGAHHQRIVIRENDGDAALAAYTFSVVK
jgi:hypothetical protein